MKKIFLIIIVLYTPILSQWIQQSSGTSTVLYKVSFPSSNTGNTVGLSGTIRRTTNGGENWTVQQSLPNEDLFAVYFLNDLTGYLAGDGSKVAKTTNGGLNWINLVPIPQLYFGINFLNENTGFMCGNGGYIIRTTNGGANWEQLSTGVTAALNDISFVNSSEGFAVGSGGTIIKTSNGGNNWSTLASGTNNLLTSISIISAETAFAAGQGGLILKTTNGGLNWASINSGTVSRITDLFFVNQNTGTAVGLGNTILRTTNGGLNWISQNSGVSGQDFHGVCFTSANNGFVVGSGGHILHTTTGGFPIPPSPNLVSPPNNATGVSVTPLLDWDSVSSATFYQVQLSADSNFASNIIDSSQIFLTSLQVSSGLLTNNFLYFWRARGINSGSNGLWSAVYRFRTIVALPSAPNLLLPTNGAMNVSLTPNFDWDSTSPADFYRLQAALDTGFVSIRLNITGITQSQYSLVSPPLQNNFRYYWRVNATNQAGTGPWSNVFNFTTVIGFPPPPVLITPPHNSNNISLTPTLDWADDITVITYQLQLSDDSTFTGTLTDSTGFNVSQLVVSAGILINITAYFWRVRTTNSLGTGPWSEVWKFTTILAPPAAPILINPPNGATNVSTTPTLDWNDVPFAETYRIQISTDSLFGTFLTNIGGLTFSQYNVPGGLLQNNTTYFWRVNATNSAGTGPFSQVWRFRTAVSPPVAAPDLISPPNGANNLSLTPTLDWNDVFGANGYRVNVSDDSLFNTTIIDTTLTPSQYTVLAGRLAGGVTYYWRVRAFNTGGSGPWSVTWRFTTFPIGIKILSSEIPKEFKLYNNYPNPFNPVTFIKFDIPKNSFIKIEIYDILGRKIESLVNQFVQEGYYIASWDASGVSSGVYFYRLVSEDFTDIKKMIVVK
ncbi:MAG: YCF48-related protein [Chlorobi bacterium]|nr:YCF48-related protein [Chlorobiota bacterium]MCI0716898.1 YCF48-related protein [Chlorobiota bacterium]